MVTRPSLRIAMFLVTTVVALVLLFNYPTSRGPDDQLSALAGAGGNDVGIVSGPGAPGGPGAAGGSAAASGPAENTAPSGGSSSTSGTTVVNGTVVPTRWGPVQVQIIITNDRITDVTALQYPRGNSRDQQINAYALPRLHDRVVAAQGANIDVVTGATVTSRGYIASVQAALDMAHFG